MNMLVKIAMLLLLRNSIAMTTSDLTDLCKSSKYLPKKKYKLLLSISVAITMLWLLLPTNKSVTMTTK